MRFTKSYRTIMSRRSQPMRTPHPSFFSTRLRPSLLGLTVTLTFGLIACSSNDDTLSSNTSNKSVTSLHERGSSLNTSQAANRLLQDVRAHFVVRRSSRHEVPSPKPAALDHISAMAARPLLGPSHVRSYETFRAHDHSGYNVIPHFSDGARAGVLKPSEVRLGSVARHVAKVEDKQSGAVISVRWVAAKRAPAESADGYLVYRDVLGTGSAALTRGDVTGAEQYVKIPAGGPKELRYEIVLGDKIAGLRQVQHGNLLEFLDEEGTPRLRMTAPLAVTGSALVPLRLNVMNCAVDTSPKSPWGRAVTDPGKRKCEVAIRWEENGEVLVDPVWTTTGDMAVKRTGHTASALNNGKALVAGGYDGSSTVASAELFDPVTETWGATGSMSGTRWKHTATVLTSGEVLVAGGETSRNGGGIDSAQQYDPNAGSWTSTSTMKQTHLWHTANVLQNGRVLVVGGCNDAPSDCAEIYNPGDKTWATTGSLNEKRYMHTASVLSNGWVLVAGGKGPHTDALRSVEIYHPAEEAWAPAMPMKYGKKWAAAGVLKDGRVLVVPGFTYFSGNSHAELYDPTTKVWTSAGYLPLRLSAQVTVLTDGRALVTGELVSSDVEVKTRAMMYDPLQNGWYVAGHTHQIRDENTATKLKDGRVLITGGEGDGNAILATSEIFTLQSIGSSCNNGAECASTHCVDKVCCDASCDQTDHQCLKSRTGQPDGKCAPVMDGVSCSANTDCGSGYCTDGVCCDTACTLADHQCIESRTGQPDGKCAPVMDGVPCTANTDCGSSYCTDGVCCDTACNGLCEGCNATVKGGGKDGACGPITANTDPENECSAGGAGVCALSGFCDGQGACDAPVGKECGAPDKCSGNTLVKAVTCNATGFCNTQPVTIDCSPYVCRNNACLDSCATSNDCISPQLCIDGKCGVGKNNGGTCNNSAQCISNKCVDGVCCDSPCDGVCERCDGAQTVSGKPGTCSPVIHGSDPDDECQLDQTNPCGEIGFCDGANKCALAPSTKNCGATCDGTATTVAKKCTGTGQCKPVSSTAKLCKPYACSAATGECMTTCTDDSDCSSGIKCDTYTGQCASAGASCSDEFTLREADGTEQDCTPYKCVGSTCSDSCTTTTDCAHGFECRESRCVSSTGSNGTGGPEEATVNQDNGCGCSVPGNNQHGKVPWEGAILVALAGLLATRRRWNLRQEFPGSES